jgi:hypothetical protein
MSKKKEADKRLPSKEYWSKESTSSTKMKIPASWKMRTKAIRTMLKRHHESCDCVEPWPLTCEVDAMMDRSGLVVGPSFCLCHPNQRFSTEMKAIKSIRTGRIRRALFLQEDSEQTCLQAGFESNGKNWMKLVPPHSPITTELMVLGEVIVHPGCLAGLRHQYSLYPGKYFKWPGGENIGVCPMTGEHVVADAKTIYLMVTWTMFGSFRVGSDVHVLNRVWPRILTLKGYERMVGGTIKQEHRCVGRTKVTMERASGVEKLREKVWAPFYPDVVKQAAADGLKMGKGRGTPGESEFFYVPKKTRTKGFRKGPVLATDAWARYSQDLWEKDYENKVMADFGKMQNKLASK